VGARTIAVCFPYSPLHSAILSHDGIDGTHSFFPDGIILYSALSILPRLIDLLLSLLRQ